MPFRVPTFNLVVEVRHATALGVWGPWIQTPGALRGLTRVRAVFSGGRFASLYPYLLLLPAQFDIRDDADINAADQVQLPGWQGLPLSVNQVWDVAYGYPNEYRVAALQKLWQAGPPGTQTILPGQGITPRA